MSLGHPNPASPLPLLRQKPTLEERIVAFLRDRRGKPYCVDCVVQRLELVKHQVRQLSKALKVPEIFARQVGRCSSCRRVRLVMRGEEPAALTGVNYVAGAPPG